MTRMPNGTRKLRLNVTVRPEAYEWVMSKIESHDFANTSHAVEWCIFNAMKDEKEERRADFRCERSRILSSAAPL